MLHFLHTACGTFHACTWKGLAASLPWNISAQRPWVVAARVITADPNLHSVAKSVSINVRIKQLFLTLSVAFFPKDWFVLVIGRKSLLEKHFLGIQPAIQWDSPAETKFN